MADIIQLMFDNSTSLSILMNQNKFVNKWLELLSTYNNQIPGQYEYDIQISGIGRDYVIDELLEVMTEINNHHPHTIPINYFHRHLSHVELSDIHFIYEKIESDNVWLSTGRLSYNCICFYKSKLNDLIHEMEAMLGKRTTPRVRFRIVDPVTKVPNTYKPELDISDYKLFEPIIRPYVVYLNYNAVGEDFIKTFKSNRDPSTAVPLTKYSPSFFFVTHAIDIHLQQHTVLQCRKWMLNAGYNSEDYKNSFGYIPLGVVFKNSSDNDISTTIKTSKLIGVNIT